MKILYKNSGFGGGAPRSLLQFAKVAKKNEIEVVAIGEYTYEPIDYRLSNIRLLELPSFVLKKPLYSFRLLRRYLKLIKDEKPDIIHAITPTNSYYHKVVFELTNIPVIYSVAGGKIGSRTANVLANENLIVHSEENKIELKKYGYKDDQITVISNRMDASESNDEYKTKYNFNEKKSNLIKILLISRFSSDKIESIKHTINLVMKLKKDNFNVRLDILGDGKYFEQVNEKVEFSNNNYKEKFIFLQGFVNETTEYILESHIVFGKGRSIVEGIFNCRISLVVTEEKSIALCNEEVFENLKKYNFTGRELEEIFSYEDLSDLIKDISENKLSLSYLPEFKKRTREFYDVKFAEKKIMKLYNNVNTVPINYKPTLIATLRKYFKFYINLIRLKGKDNKNIINK